MRGRRRRRLSMMIAGGWFALRRRLLCEISYEFVDGFWVFLFKTKELRGTSRNRLQPEGSNLKV